MKQKPTVPAHAAVELEQALPRELDYMLKHASAGNSLGEDEVKGSSMPSNEPERMHLRECTPVQRRYLRKLVLGYVLVFGLYLVLTCGALLYHQHRYKDNNDSNATTSPQLLAAAQKASETAVRVECGTYVESISQISLRDGTYTISMEVWFSWEGVRNLNMLNHFRLYQGRILSMDILRDTHTNAMHFQRARIVAVVQEDYATSSFPLDSHQLYCFLESNYPANEVTLEADIDCSGMNPSLSVSGYTVDNVSLSEMYYAYPTSHGEPDSTGEMIVSEVVTRIDLSREGFGLYFKCFVALVGTTTWVFIAMFINTYHHVDPLGMVPAALFGTVSNILVGASLVPDSLRLGLLEVVNLFGIVTILGITISIITVNRLRARHRQYAFAGLLGRVLFWTLLGFSVAGNVLMPLASL